MHDDHDDSPPPASDDPETHARDAVEAIRAKGEGRSDVESSILGVGRAHARVLVKINDDAE